MKSIVYIVIDHVDNGGRIGLAIFTMFDKVFTDHTASVVMLFRSKTSILFISYFCTSLVYYIIQNVLVNKKIENRIFI